MARGLLRLDRNYNPYGPSPDVLRSMREALPEVGFLCPEAQADALTAAVARFHGVDTDRVVLGCGSGEILRMAVDACLGGRRLVHAEPTYDMMAVYARRAGADVVAVPLRPDYSHDLDAMRAHATEAGLVYICNPNNPTGTVTPRREIEEFIDALPATVHVLIDEAYHDYVSESPDYQSFIDRSVRSDRVIVTRTFSKVHGLEALRVGYAITAPGTARRLRARGLSRSVGSLAAEAAIATLRDPEYVRLSARRNADARQEFHNQVDARMLRAVDSRTNFVLLNTGRPGAEVVEHFRAHAIAVSGPFPGFEHHVRVAIGDVDATAAFWRVWELLPGHKMVM